MDAADLVARVEALESANRRLRAWGGLLAVGLAAVVTLGQAAPPAKSLQAESLTLRDAGGRKRIVLGGDADGWGVTVFDAKEVPRAGMRVDDKGAPVVQVLDATGGCSAELAAFGDAAGMYLRAEGGKLRGYFTTSGGLPIWDLLDRSGKTRCGASIADAGSAGISLFGKDGATRAGLINNPDDSTRLTLRTGPLDAEKKGCELQVYPDGGAKVELSDALGKSSLVLGIKPDGSAGLNVFDGAKKVRLGLAALPGVSVLQLFGAPGVKGAELHVADMSSPPKDMRAKEPPAALVLFDANGKETQ